MLYQQGTISFSTEGEIKVSAQLILGGRIHSHLAQKKCGMAYSGHSLG